jgi:hypothetical protein
MKDTPLIAVNWRPRGEPLAAVAAAARGKAAGRLAQRLLDCFADSSDNTLSALDGVAGPDLIIVLGEERELPWVDGVCYLGRDGQAPSLLIPTTMEPSVPIALLERALAVRFANLSPLAVLPDDLLIVPLGSSRPLALESIREWLKKHV